MTSLGTMLAAVHSSRPLLSANDRSRWCTVWSLVERQTFQIDEIIQRRGWDTIDKVYHERHFYSTKPALLPTMVAGLYWAIKHTLGWDLVDRTADVTQLILVIINVLPMAIAIVLIAAIAEKYAQTDLTRLFVVFAAAFGTLLTPFVITFNNHTTAACSVVFALYAMLRIVADGERRAIYFALAGFFASFAATNELPAALLGVLMFALVFRAAPKQALCWFVPAAVIPVTALVGTTYWQTGGWKPFYMYYGTEKYLFEVDGQTSYWANPKGIDKGGDSPLVYLLHCTIGHHGIFSLSPIFLLTLAGWIRWRDWRQSRIASAIVIGLAMTVAVLAFYLTRTENYNYGGVTSGLRWMFWLIPFWLIAIVPVFDALGSRRWFRMLALVLLAVSVFSAFRPIQNPWQHPWLFQLMQQAGWIDYR